MQIYILSLLIWMLPLITLAQAPTDFRSLVNIFIRLINQLIPFIIGLTVLVLTWGIMKAWIINGGDEKSVEAGKQLALVGIFALVIMLGIWGILAVLRSTFFGV